MNTQFSEKDPGLLELALKAFAEIAEAWSLTTHEQLSILGMPVGTDLATLDAVAVTTLPSQGLERISYLIGIHRVLHTLFPNSRQANTWVRRANAAALFNGGTAIALMCSGGIDGLSSVRQYLEAGGMIDVQR